MGTPPSAFRTLQLDAPLVQDAGYEFDKFDRAYIDDQARSLQQQMLLCLLLGVVATWTTLDASSAAVAIGDGLWSSSATSGTVTRTTGTGPIAGIALTAAAPGARVCYAVAGILPAAVTGLATGAAGYVRLVSNRCQKVAALGPGDVGVGYVDALGQLTLVRALVAPESGTIASVTHSSNNPYTVAGSDLLVEVDVSGGVATVNMPASPATGERHSIKNVAGDASVSNITVGGGGHNIEDPNSLQTFASSVAMKVKGGSVSWIYDGTHWVIY